MPKSRSNLPYPKLMNIIGYQAIWFGLILGGNAFVPVAVLLVLVHSLSCTEPRREAIVLLTCTVIGFACDSLLTIVGVYHFEPMPTILPAPLWLVVIWLGFSATLRHGLSFAIEKPALGLALAAVGAPFSYLAAARLGAVNFPLGSLVTASILVGTWLVLMGLFIVIVRSVDACKREEV